MRESLFIKKNLARWKKYQEEPTDDPDEMSDRFVSVLDDLSYAKTFYSFSKVTRYINSIAANIFQKIYAHKKNDDGRFQLFFKYELPLLFRKYHRTLLYSFCFFTIFVLIGSFSSAHDDTFVRGVLGDEYINMTERNIASGDPFGVYKGESPLLMFLYIAFNNIYVSMQCFVFGIFLSFGTLYFLFRNGVMVGAFHYIFVKHGLGWKAVLIVMTHGTLELSSIVIAGCAGMILGNSLLFPGTLTRLESLKRAARDGIKIMISLIPVFIVAAFLEGFITRYSAMPALVSILILLASLGFIIFYFIWYPIRLHKQGYAISENGKITITHTLPASQD
ncbi:putative membrane protein SpoIIM required for sporulation [Chitinophaga dinghuensis]|uniref:Putative membrane protein SpoIIM required for sporulation n=1 Tax=Chitinophaga dinghuensis TaxID=1539050 RepID=A0A327W9Z5_9BACT|nr:stage II sporulation protein M [Chitinophaga dinghuensis]RAJ87537.1 putative membrane protein SpoIIM required for sporulation [Chitinophaga dinghuensis]